MAQLSDIAKYAAVNRGYGDSRGGGNPGGEFVDMVRNADPGGHRAAGQSTLPHASVI